MTDLIRREDVEKAMQSICDMCGEYEKNCGVMCGSCNLDSFIRVLDEVPPAEPGRKWIPVNEALPEEKGEYLVSYHPCHWNAVSEKVVVGMDTFRGKTTWAKKKYQKVIAWMPLIEPYRGE